MLLILTIAVPALLLTCLFVAIRWGHIRLTGPVPVGLFSFIAILFTSGLDVGLVMFPLTEFPTYESEAPYQFTNPLAIEFGFWGFLIWAFYFLTTFYFCAVEPKLKLFEIPLIKAINNIVIIGTCAFTGFLFLTYLPSYINGIEGAAKFALVAFVILCAVSSSTDIRFVKILSLTSTWLFFALISGMFFASNMGLTGFVQTAANLGGYFTNLHRFTTPITDYHAFYLYWWFAWSIMIGQFVARFVGGLSVRQLLLALLVFPSIPIALWFTVLYYVYANEIAISGLMNTAMIIVGVMFVINSLDSLTRLYTDNLNLSVKRFGRLRYVAIHWALLFGLVLLYQFTPLKIEWIGLVVIGIYLAIAGLMFIRRRSLQPNPAAT